MAPKLPKADWCLHCYGSGWDSDVSRDKKCHICGGSGKRPVCPSPGEHRGEK